MATNTSRPEIANEKYVRLTTYKKDGTPKYVPVWIEAIGEGTVAFTTASSSYKVKRIANTSAVKLQASDSRGNVKDGTTELSGNATVVRDDDFEIVRTAIKKKYGLQMSFITAVGKFMKLVGKGSGTDAAVVVELENNE